jgi:YD repeat-containing protein
MPKTNYANPHAPTSFFSGSATTTYAYNANGNLTGTTGAATSSFTWDYRNRMIAALVSGATTTYGYGETVQRVRQTSTTTHYPNKFYSVESCRGYHACPCRTRSRDGAFFGYRDI